MNVFWSARTPRERMMIWALGGFVAVWLVIAGIVQPLQAYRLGLTAQTARYQQAVQRLQSPAQVAISADSRTIPVIITESAAAYQLTIQRLQPADTTVQIVLDDAPFDAVLLWIDSLTADYALQVVTLDVIRRSGPGQVSTSLSVTR